MKISENCVELFDGRLTKYGGHWQKLSYLTGLDYLIISKGNFFKKHTSLYYDGYHHAIDILFLNVCWGGPPYKETQL